MNFQDVVDRVHKSRKGKEPWDGRHIYIVQCDEYVKVGIATKVFNRVNEMRVGNPRELKLLAYWPSANAVIEEHEIHQLLNQYWVRGEWFKLPSELLAAILN